MGHSHDKQFTAHVWLMEMLPCWAAAWIMLRIWIRVGLSRLKIWYLKIQWLYIMYHDVCSNIIYIIYIYTLLIWQTLDFLLAHGSSSHPAVSSMFFDRFLGPGANPIPLKGWPPILVAVPFDGWTMVISSSSTLWQFHGWLNPSLAAGSNLFLHMFVGKKIQLLIVSFFLPYVSLFCFNTQCVFVWKYCSAQLHGESPYVPLDLLQYLMEISPVFWPIYHIIKFVTSIPFSKSMSTPINIPLNPMFNGYFNNVKSY